MEHILARTAFLLLSSLATTYSDELNPLSSHGTIVVLLPTREGLVVASDSRSNIFVGNAATHCDSTVKIVALKHHPRTVIAVAGMDKTFGHLTTNCADLVSNSSSILSLKEIASSYLDRQRSEIKKIVLAGLEAHVLQKVKGVQVKYPRLLHSGGDGRTFATILVGRYVPEEHLSTYAIFRICILPGERAEICDKAWHEYHLADRPQTII